MVGENRAIVVLTDEAASRDGKPRPVVTAGNSVGVRVVLDWDELHLADVMIKIHLRYMPAWGERL